MDLFDAPIAPLQVLNDMEGGVRYWPQLLPAALAQDAFEALRDGADWRSQRREMYDRVVDVPRLLASYRLDGALPAGLPLQRLLDAVQAVLPAPYNAVGLNLYRDGRDSVAMHHDALHTLVAPYPIALLSLGAPRRMQLRANDASTRTSALELAPGSLLAMSHASQHTHTHGIAKTTRAVGERISVVFRVRPAERMAAGQHGPHWTPAQT
ncbi:alpha-ketoglutarate-dependent dioxygenase AlkB [Xanthomonas vasicola]|uniref:DNA-3-methyladenine glycosylase n=1 Tax=Xanthomonas vasicola pv. vasculorum NCPPB 890 TaxID=1184265 RepID=A0A836P5P6_XANVA|nr:alpha-ketoglutarate-dependent dioxygenase AlkB [Xanthomonas vasicola]KFA27804.1 DNA-3-methyladenine glycosylase [Xanthomonas vasicola pv. vasculorum NCPPB 1326]KFA33909.1 DNA-3-methyladenine glycosylase [Xanthomonas vasicola pv. vasculorum NCPPB 1381]MBV6748209.1 alpha-ketoglutarate-dependent dioxygenase AlkB [Xanthomonas vasicola pv. vasculorum NCPPB 890]MBV6893830.1 alpha-ketoglutarate-dependent dioxygenase AlkB [Xanthomonas vasicola pv. vasculorum]MDO6949522.1 alpha-ketoglutarate-depende